MEKMLLKSTTRHVRIFTADVVNNDLKFHPNKLTLDLDPDNEFIWNEDTLKKVNQKFIELVEERSGKNLDDYVYTGNLDEKDGITQDPEILTKSDE